MRTRLRNLFWRWSGLSDLVIDIGTLQQTVARLDREADRRAAELAVMSMNTTRMNEALSETKTKTTWSVIPHDPHLGTM